MATKTTYYAQMKHMISYRFICEHCGMDSQSRIREIKSLAEANTRNGRRLSPDEESRLHQDARMDLIKTVQAEKDAVAAGDYAAFDGRCGYCRKYQSWAGGTIGSSVAKKAARHAVIAGLIMFLVFLGMLASEYGFLTSFLCYAATVAATYGISFLICYLKWSAIRRSGQSARTRNLPTIDWQGM